jgi:hypothetical protein
MSKVLVVVEGNDGGEKEVYSGVQRLMLPVPHESVPILPKENPKIPHMKFNGYIRYLND